MTSTSRLNGGVFYALAALLPRVARAAGAEVRVFGSSDAHTEADRGAWGGVPVEAFPPWGSARFGFSPRLFPALREFGPKVVHVHGLWTYASAASLRLRRRGTCRLVVSPHGMLDPWALQFSRTRKRVVSAVFQAAQLRAADLLHALTEAEARSLRAYGLRNPIVVLPNGVDLPAAPADAGAGGTGPRRLLFLGRLHPKKGLDALIDAWARVRSERTAKDPWQLVIAGWDEVGHRADLEAQVAALGLAETVRFLGPVFGDEKRVLLAGCDGFVLTSHSEGLPVAVLEAWSHGKPALLSRACNLPEGAAAGAAIEVEVTGESIHAGLSRLVGMEDGERRAMGQAGRRLVERRFAWDRIAEDFGRVYRSLTDAGGDIGDLLYRGEGTPPAIR